jgi:hypothetical protein
MLIIKDLRWGRRSSKLTKIYIHLFRTYVNFPLDSFFNDGLTKLAFDELPSPKGLEKVKS